jgi:excinuclease ABC subunit B
MERAGPCNIVEQIIRPTGLLDPVMEVRPASAQVDDLLDEIRKRVERNERVLVTTLTKRMAEDLTEYYASVGVKVEYLHSDIKTVERTSIIQALRRGDFDVLVGINLLREGLDIPEVSLVAVLDADKEGFLRSERSLIQTAGRASRNSEGMVILYADRVTESMKRAMSETQRRRGRQAEYNKAHGITPLTIKKGVRDSLSSMYEDEQRDSGRVEDETPGYGGYKGHERLAAKITALEKEMKAAAKALDFERAARIRDEIKGLKGLTG